MKYSFGLLLMMVLFAVSALVTVAVAWAVTRYVAQPLVPRPLALIARSPKRA